MVYPNDASGWYSSGCSESLGFGLVSGLFILSLDKPLWKHTRLEGRGASGGRCEEAWLALSASLSYLHLETSHTHLIVVKEGFGGRAWTIDARSLWLMVVGSGRRILVQALTPVLLMWDSVLLWVPLQMMLVLR